MNDIRILKVEKDSPLHFYYKTSFEDKEFKAVSVRNQRLSTTNTLQSISLTPAYKQKLRLKERKKEDLMNLIQKNYIPQYYKDFYANL